MATGAELKAQRELLEQLLDRANTFEAELSAAVEAGQFTERDAQQLRLAEAAATRANNELISIFERVRRYKAAAVLLVLLLPALASAQVCPFNAYVVNSFTERCSLNPYDTERRPNGDLVPKRVCASDALLAAPAVKLAISEGQVGTMDHERGYIVLANTSMEPQNVIVEIMLRGNNTTTFIKRLRIDALSSETVDLVGDPLFQCSARFFNTIVYAERELTAEMLIYALRDTSHPLAFLTTDKDGLPIAGGTR